MDDFQIIGIWHDVTDLLECSEVFSRLESKIPHVEDTEIVGSEGSDVAADSYSFSNLVCCCPRLLIQVVRVQKAQFSYRLDGLVP